MIERKLDFDNKRKAKKMKELVAEIEAGVNRLLFAVVTWILGFILIHKIVNILAGGFLDHATIYSGIVLSTVLWFVAAGSTIGFFLVSVPEYAGLVTVSALTGNLHAYLTGMHFRFPWEQVKKENYVSTELITVPYREHFPTKDGGVVAISGSYEYRVDKRPDKDYEMIITYVGIDESTIVTGVYNLIQAVLTEHVGGINTSEIKTMTSSIQRTLDQKFGVSNDDNNPGAIQLSRDEVVPIEKRYGIIVSHVRAGNVEYVGDTQTALSAALKSDKTIEAAGKLKAMDKKDVEDAMVLVGSATKSIQKFDLGLGDLAKVPPETLQVLGELARAILQSQGRFGGRQGQSNRPKQGQGGQGNNPAPTQAPAIASQNAVPTQAAPANVTPAPTEPQSAEPTGGIEAGEAP